MELLANSLKSLELPGNLDYCGLDFKPMADTNGL